jgi:hypothetical protein
MLRSFIPLIIISLGFGCSDLGIEPLSDTQYYWSGGRQIFLTKDRSSAIVVYTDASDRYRTFQFRYKRYEPLRVVLTEHGVDLARAEWYSFGYRISNVQIFPTNRIAFALKEGIDRSELDNLIRGLATYDTTHYITGVLKVIGQEGDVFGVANKIYESGIVRYSHPDFLVQVIYGRSQSVGAGSVEWDFCATDVMYRQMSHV